MVSREPLSCEALRAWFPNLEILELVGVGGMGAVYKARQPRLDRAVALKILTCSSEHRADFALRFEREAQVMARLNHPGIVSVYDFGEVDRASAGLDPLYYLLMEHVDGADLSRLIGSEELTFGRAMEFVKQICSALQYAHDQGVTHRDIKPSNLLVDRRGNLKIADFGLAKLLRSDVTLALEVTLTGTAMGTPRYMAPEQWDALGRVDHRADIYSLGVVIHELVAKEREPGDLPPSSSERRGDPRVAAVIAKAMEREPERRFQSAAQLEEALRRVIGPRRGNPMLRWAAGVATLLIAGFGTKVLVGKRGGTVVAPQPRPSEGIGSAGVGYSSVPASGAIEDDGPPAAGLFSPTMAHPFVNSLGMKFVPVPGTEVLFCIHETRRRDYAAYYQEMPDVDGIWKGSLTFDGFTLSGSSDIYPVTNVSFEDARGFCLWLAEKEGKTYRLPTDWEWSLAVGLGGKENWSEGALPSAALAISDEFPWGSAWPPPKDAGNYSDQSRKLNAPRSGTGYLDGYDDSFPTTSPVMSFPPNPFGLHDMGGNVWEWVDDWYSKAKTYRVMRGGSWHDSERSHLLSSFRFRRVPDGRVSNYGFRVVLGKPANTGHASRQPVSGPGNAPSPDTLGPEGASQGKETGETKAFGSVEAARRLPAAPAGHKPAAGPPAPLRASRERPFENSLGMKFVPVPGTGVLFCIHEARYKDYAAYAEQNPGIDGRWRNQSIDGYEITGRAEDHPVLSVSWADAKAFCEWLGRQEGRTYRLPTDREWSVAVGLGDKERPSPYDTPERLKGKVESEYPWGTAWPPPPGAGNYSDESRKAKTPSSREDAGYLDGYDDGWPTTAPVMSFAPNLHGLHDMGGNAREWIEDWWSNERRERVMRGSMWEHHMESALRSSFRRNVSAGAYDNSCGFRPVIVVNAGD